MNIQLSYKSYLAKRVSFAGLLMTLIAASGAGVAQSSTSGQASCSNSQSVLSPDCQSTTGATQQQTPLSLEQSAGSGFTDSQRNSDSQGIYVDSAGTDTRRRIGTNSTSPIPSSEQKSYFSPPDPLTDFQKLARTTTGESLPIFGRDLFQHAPSTFAPADQIPVTADYVIGPGDELLIRLWGPQTLNSQLTVDTNGEIYIPKVGTIHVAGLRYDQLQKQLTSDISRIYRNFNLSINLGHMRSIQVYIVGEAKRPGAFTISSLSTVLNALFVSGGPSVQGSLRNIQIRRGGQPPMQFDLYDLILHGDKSKDVRLEQGDTIFIPTVGPQVALAGSVRHPAIYELRDNVSLSAIIQYAGGFSSVAAADRITLERIDQDHARKALTLQMDSEGSNLSLRDGDVLFVNHIDNSYEKSVTIRGNLANPGRFPWHSGMRLSEIIPDRMSLLTLDYWRDRNRLGVPTPLFEPLPSNNIPSSRGSMNQPLTSRENGAGSQSTVDSAKDESDLQAQALRASASMLALQSSQLPSTENGRTGAAGNRSDENSTGSQPPPGLTGSKQNRINIPTADIDWSYAVIERLDPNTLRTSLLPFNLGKLVQEKDPAQNLELQPGDVVTILSQADIPVPLDEQTKYIRLEGEFVSAGTYSVGPNETLEDVVRRAGGLSPKAYLYGSSFFRESARVFQQQRLDEYISTLTADMERASAVRAASSSTGIIDPNALAQQRSLITQLRELRSTGRIVLEFQPSSSTIDTIPKITLENGDVFRIPSRPNTVSVIGAVYGQNVFLYNPSRRVEGYVALAGKPNRIADSRHAFIIRADGSIYSHERAKGIWKNNFNVTRINPGDSIVIPERPIRPTALKQLTDYSQILSSFGLAAAAITVLH